MNCATCRGACCETFSLPDVFIRYARPGPDALRWVALHGERRGSSIQFECRCTALTPEGRCSVYASRPIPCITFKAGGPECLETVRHRRTPEEYERIREDGDPERIHD